MRLFGISVENYACFRHYGIPLQGDMELNMEENQDNISEVDIHPNDDNDYIQDNFSEVDIHSNEDNDYIQDSISEVDMHTNAIYIRSSGQIRPKTPPIPLPRKNKTLMITPAPHKPSVKQPKRKHLDQSFSPRLTRSKK